MQPGSAARCRPIHRFDDCPVRRIRRPSIVALGVFRSAFPVSIDPGDSITATGARGPPRRTTVYRRAKTFPLTPSTISFRGIVTPALSIPFRTIAGSPAQQGASMTAVVTLLTPAVLKISVNFST